MDPSCFAGHWPVMKRLVPFLLVACPALAEPAVAPIDLHLEPLREISACPARRVDVARDMRIALIVGPEGLEADREMRAAQARLCERLAREEG